MVDEFLNGAVLVDKSLSVYRDGKFIERGDGDRSCSETAAPACEKADFTEREAASRKSCRNINGATIHLPSADEVMDNMVPNYLTGILRSRMSG